MQDARISKRLPPNVTRPNAIKTTKLSIAGKSTISLWKSYARDRVAARAQYVGKVSEYVWKVWNMSSILQNMSGKYPRFTNKCLKLAEGAPQGTHHTINRDPYMGSKGCYEICLKSIKYVRELKVCEKSMYQMPQNDKGAPEHSCTPWVKPIQWEQGLTTHMQTIILTSPLAYELSWVGEGLKHASDWKRYDLQICLESIEICLKSIYKNMSGKCPPLSNPGSLTSASSWQRARQTRPHTT